MTHPQKTNHGYNKICPELELSREKKERKTALLSGNSETRSRARDVLSSNKGTRKMDFDSWYIAIIVIMLRV